MEEDAVLSVRGVTTGYGGRTVLHDISLEYGPGVHVLLGSNGAGKTTLFRTLAAVLPPHRGQVLVRGRDPHREPAAKRLIGVAAHRPALAPRLSVRDNLRYWAAVLDLPRAQREPRVTRIIADLGLDDLAAQGAGTLSRGQTQRVALAKAMLADPAVLLLDEPTSGLDPAASASLRGQLRDLASAQRTILTSTHNMNEAQLLADDVTVLQHGRVLARGRPGELREKLVGQETTLRLRARLDLLGPLRRLGYTAQPDRYGGVTVRLAGDAAQETLIEQLVHEGVGLREATPAGNALEDLFLHLQEQDKAGSQPGEPT